MTQEINTPVQRFDRDLTPVVDSHEERMRKLKEHLSRPILASEASDEVRLNGNALRKHADLDAIKEHPYTRHVREYREKKSRK
jgi:hypothetical protein